MKMLSVLFVTMAVLLIGCTKYPEYDPPQALAFNRKNVKTINKNFEKTWTALIDYASSSFFGIDNFEKDSGLMTLDFGSSNPEEFIDCGTVYAVAVKYDGPFVEGVQAFGSGVLDGRMNLFVKSISQNVTEVKVKANYKFTVESGTSKQTWSFDTGGSDSKKFGAIPNNVVCRPTNVAEEDVLKAIDKIAKGIPIY